MNKFKKIVLSILGGVDVTFTIFSPIILVALWVTVGRMQNWTDYFIYIIGILATMFRAIKIGWLKHD